MLNMGGPDRLSAVRPFLYNLFSDPAIFRLPRVVRWLAARIVSSRRARTAREIYAKMGGGSPILKITEAQARALQAALSNDLDARVFIAMRYWHPMSRETVKEVLKFAPDEVVLLPLYPQYSTTTSASSLADWRTSADRLGLRAPTRAICCYPAEPSFVASVAGLVRDGIEKTRRSSPDVRVLFSAHGLPERVIEAGDPYQWQVEQGAAAVARELEEPDLDWVVCYQSRVGPLVWIGPSTEEEIDRAGRENKALVVVPIAFVSEHSETLVELDIDYRDRAAEAGVPVYIRVPTVGTDPCFIASLATLVGKARSQAGPCRQGGDRRCPCEFGGCALHDGESPLQEIQA